MARDIRILLGGINSLPTDYDSRIQNFLDHYLGSPEQPEPFGGRETDLARLDAWFEDLQQPPYLLLAAPAGRGKSALLVHWWADRLRAREDVAVLFFPISIRFRTNLASVFFASVAARLAALRGEAIPSAVDTPAEVWRGMMTDYFTSLPDGRRLLLILDGMDEAADWEIGPDLFPLQAPKSVRLLISARYLAGDKDASDWLHRLNWAERPSLARFIDLDTLTREGIADVLKRMGFPLAQLVVTNSQTLFRHDVPPHNEI